MFSSMRLARLEILFNSTIRIDRLSRYLRRMHSINWRLLRWFHPALVEVLDNRAAAAKLGAQWIHPGKR